jgi:hypothetical protein
MVSQVLLLLGRPIWEDLVQVDQSEAVLENGRMVSLGMWRHDLRKLMLARPDAVQHMRLFTNRVSELASQGLHWCRESG